MRPGSRSTPCARREGHSGPPLAPQFGRHAARALELAAEVIDIGEAAQFGDFGDRSRSWVSKASACSSRSPISHCRGLVRRWRRNSLRVCEWPTPVTAERSSAAQPAELSRIAAVTRASGGGRSLVVPTIWRSTRPMNSATSRLSRGRARNPAAHRGKQAIEPGAGLVPSVKVSRGMSPANRSWRSATGFGPSSRNHSSVHGSRRLAEWLCGVSLAIQTSCPA